MRRYLKLAAQVLATVLVALIPGLTAGGLDAVEWVNVAIVGVGAAAVFTAPNVPGAPVTKAILSSLAAILVVLSSAIVGGLDSAEWLQIIVAALGAVGVYAVKGPVMAGSVYGAPRGVGRTDSDLV